MAPSLPVQSRNAGELESHFNTAFTTEILTDADSTEPTHMKKTIKKIDKDQRLKSVPWRPLYLPRLWQLVEAGQSYGTASVTWLGTKHHTRFTKPNQTHGPPWSRLKALSTVWCSHSPADWTCINPTSQWPRSFMHLWFSTVNRHAADPCCGLWYPFCV